jgi:cytochrome P450
MTVAPGYTQWIPLPFGAFGEVLRDPLGFQLRARERFGDVVRFRNGTILVHFLYHPDHVRRVLHDCQKHYLRGWQYRLLRRLFGDNLVVSDGDFWMRQRRLAQPAFHRDRLAKYAEVMVDATGQMLGRWGDAAAEQAIDVWREMSRLTLAIAGRALFSQDASQEADAVGREFGIVASYLEQRFNKPLTLPVWVPTATNRQFKAAKRTLYAIVQEFIRERRREGGDRGDLLSMLMQARDEETGEQMTDEQLCCEALTFLIAGHETTATALAWTWFLLASHAAVRQRVREEIEAVLGDRPPTAADVPRLRMTRMVIEEAMRLYPPIWALTREAVVEDEVGGYRIPAGSMIVLSPFVTHRHPDFWEKPDVFDPDQFSAERVAQRPKGAYFPFLSGPHQCIGNEFAMLEMCLIVAGVLQKFDLELRPGQAIQPKASLALRPNGPVWVMLKPMGDNRVAGSSAGQVVGMNQ